MKCFNHQDRDSVGICRICGKAVCKDCALSSAFGLTCKGACEKSVTQMNGQMERLKNIQSSLKSFSGYYALVIGILIGLLFFVVGGTGLVRYVILILGLGLIIFGITLIRRNKSSNLK